MFFSALFVAFGAALVQAQASDQIKQLKNHPTVYDGSQVEVIGFVTQYVDNGSDPPRAFLLRGDFGFIVPVHVAGDLPAVGTRVAVNGVSAVNESNGFPFVRSNTIELAESEFVIRSEPTAETATRTSQSLSNETFWILVGTLGALLFGLMGLSFYLLKALKGLSGTGLAGEVLPISSGIKEDRLVNALPPPPGFIKKLPGRFEVVDGMDRIRDVRFFNPNRTESCEISLGRAQGRAYEHVQLKAPSVANRHARLIYSGSSFSLENMTTRRTTKINGRELAPNESVLLSDQDTVQLGDIGLKFHAK